MEIKDKDYRIVFDSTTSVVTFEGVLRLRGMTEYKPIVELLDAIVALDLAEVTLNVQNLRFLNSSGINMLFQFVIKFRDQTDGKLIVCGSRQISWQTQSLKNLYRLMPELQLEMV